MGKLERPQIWDRRETWMLSETVGWKKSDSIEARDGEHGRRTERSLVVLGATIKSQTLTSDKLMDGGQDYGALSVQVEVGVEMQMQKQMEG